MSQPYTSNFPPLKHSGGGGLRELVKTLKANARPPAKPYFRTADAKRAAKVLESLGKSVNSIELLPGGGFRVMATDPNDGAKKAEDAWDKAVFGDK